MKRVFLIATLMTLLIYCLVKKISVSMLGFFCLWKVPAFLNPYEFSSVEMVLVDEKGKIHATVRKLLMALIDGILPAGVTRVLLLILARDAGAHPIKFDSLVGQKMLFAIDRSLNQQLYF
ncbi:hypothetical protein TSUD_373500 [Trifolium subterraneum]|uniref:Uncharacterized protein n=1 Tax=Trifolium subterraneum TaxID=3900 RepID=A0A2Z6NXI6_TRISU|nr:hypothetical protein TSUD_373500 [Trifolium subterraneum]